MKIFFSIILTLLCFSATAQKTKQKDTIYYLTDTLHADGMVTVDYAGDYKFYTIHCPCLDSGDLPAFRCNVGNYINLGITLPVEKFIHLPDLIELVRKNDNGHFDDKFVLFFIGQDKLQYIKQRAFFMGGKNTIAN